MLCRWCFATQKVWVWGRDTAAVCAVTVEVTATNSESLRIRSHRVRPDRFEEKQTERQASCVDSSSERNSLRRAIDTERARMADQIAALQRSFADIVEAAELTSTDDEHDPEGATIAYERALVSALLHRASDDLAALDSARKRIDDGTIETCVVCSGPIGMSRLLALPSVRTCISCAS